MPLPAGAAGPVAGYVRRLKGQIASGPHQAG